MKKLMTFPVEELQIKDEIYITIGLNLSDEAQTSDKNRIHLRNLLSEAENKLENLDDKATIEAFKIQLDKIRTRQRELTAHRNGLVIYITIDDIYYYHLHAQTNDLVDVGLLPHFKPLIENFQFSSNYHVLVLSREKFRLYEGDELGISPVKIEDEDAPINLEQALGTEKTGGALTHGSFGSRGTEGNQSFHGHNETSAEKDIDRENYFRIVDNYIYENYSLPQETSLILYSLPENQQVFREISKNQFLLEVSINESGTRTSDQDIEKKVLEKHQEIIYQEKQDLMTMFRETTPEFKIENHLDDLAFSAVQGRIEQLIINRNYTQNGSINEDGLYQEDNNNFLKQIVARVFQTGGKVYLLDEDELPEDVNITARLRY